MRPLVFRQQCEPLVSIHRQCYVPGGVLLRHAWLLQTCVPTTPECGWLVIWVQVFIVTTPVYSSLASYLRRCLLVMAELVCLCAGIS